MLILISVAVATKLRFRSSWLCLPASCTSSPPVSLPGVFGFLRIIRGIKAPVVTAPKAGRAPGRMTSDKACGMSTAAIHCSMAAAGGESSMLFWGGLTPPPTGQLSRTTCTGWRSSCGLSRCAIASAMAGCHCWSLSSDTGGLARTWIHRLVGQMV